MNQYNEISTLQYMGSKTRIISHICEPIIKNKSIKTVVDLFAGTGSVGYALKAHKNIISNDLEYYAYAPMITKKAVIPSGKQASFERNRNLFYVCCSRPKKRLIFFVTVPIDSTFKSFLVELVGEQNIFTFSQYIERKSIK